MPLAFDLQGHRGARGQRPENTLPSFEAAFDAGVTSVETDLLLTRAALGSRAASDLEELFLQVTAAASPGPGDRELVA